MPGIDQSILLTLLQHGRMTFRAMQKATKISPRILRGHLDQLVKKRLAGEKGLEGWKRGKKLFYTITEKGRKHVAAEAVADFESAFKTILGLAKTFSHDQEKLAKTRVAFRFPPPSREDKRPLEALFREYEKHERKTRGILHETLKLIYDTYLEIEVPEWFRSVNKEGFAIAIGKNGRIHLIPVAFLKKKRLGIGL